MEKILIGVDDTKCSLRAIDYVGKQLTGRTDFEITLLHILPNLPASLWDDGHILSEDERKIQKKLIDRWNSWQVIQVESLLQTAQDILERHGLREDQIKKKFIGDSNDVADSILDTASQGEFTTIVVGRCGISEGKHLLLGSVTSKVIHKGAGIAIWVVE